MNDVDYLKLKSVGESKFNLENYDSTELEIIANWEMTESYSLVKRLVTDMEESVTQKALDAPTKSNLIEFAELCGAHKSFRRILRLPEQARRKLEQLKKSSL